MTKSKILIVALLSLLAASLVAGAQNAAPLGIIPTPNPTPTPLTASVWTDKSSYVIGENVTVYVNVSQPAYVYLYDIQPDGIVRLVFPNAYSQLNYVSAGTHTLPDGSYRFTVYPPTGVEQLQLFASPVPLGLTPSSFSEAFPMAGPSAGAAASSIQAQIMGIVPEPEWTTAWTSFTILSSYSYTPPTTTPPSGGYYYYSPYPYPPFYGVPGGSWYWSDGAWHYGVPASGWYWYFGSDGKWHFRITIHIGIGG
jgi:hypothetical protein